jgi:hypothetical protein
MVSSRNALLAFGNPFSAEVVAPIAPSPMV